MRLVIAFLAFTLWLLDVSSCFEIRHKLKQSPAVEYSRPRKQYLKAEGPNNDGRIIDGVPASPGEFPFLVSIQSTGSFGQKYHHCGGTIYNETIIITAAHCVKDLDAQYLRVIAGDHDLFIVEGTEQVRNVASSVYNANYDVSSKFNDDTAVVILDRPLVFNDRVAPLRLADPTVEPTGECVNPGWGNTATGGAVNLPATPQKTTLTIIERSVCARSYASFVSITAGMICAGGNGNSGSCNGDSGGPLICTNADGEAYLAGIVSFGISPCGNADKYPSVFANVAHYIGWITDNIGAI